MSKNKILFFCFVFATLSLVAQKHVIEKYTNKKDKNRYFVPLGVGKVPYITCDSAKFYRKEFFASDCEFRNPRPDSVLYSTQSFYIDKEYVSNKDYREFVKYVEDSILRTRLGYLLNKGTESELVDWKRKINYHDSLVFRFYSKELLANNIKPDSLKYRCWWIDFKPAPPRGDVDNRYIYEDDTVIKKIEKERWQYSDVYGDGLTDRSVFIKMSEVLVYPDTLIWMKDTVNHLSMEEKIMLSRFYFSDPTFDNSPVVGLSGKQIKAYLVWLTTTVNGYLIRENKAIVNDYRLPTFVELAFLRKSQTPADGFILDSLQDSIVVKAKEYAHYLDWCKSNQISSISFLKEDYFLKNFEINFDESVLPSRYTEITLAIFELNKLKNTNVKVGLTYSQAIAFFYWQQMKSKHFYALLPTKQEYQNGKYDCRELDVILPPKPFRPAQTFIGRKKGDVNDSQVY